MAISVVVTCHNEERFIEKAIESIVGQTAFSEIEQIIVVNDGSTDRSQEILDGMAAKIEQLEVLQCEGVGVSAARNLAIAKATGDFIAFLDGDDFWMPEKIERQLPAFAVSSKIGLVYSDFCDFSKDDLSDLRLVPVRRYRVSHELPFSAYFVHDGPVVPSTIIVRRSVFGQVGVFDTNLNIGEDTDMCLRIAEHWYFEHVRGGLTCKRRDEGNLTADFEALIPVGEVLARRVVERNPAMALLADKALARRYASVGNYCFKMGRRRDGILYLWQALKKNPYYWRIYAYITMAAMPLRLADFVRRGVVRVWSEATIAFTR